MVSDEHHPHENSTVDWDCHPQYSNLNYILKYLDKKLRYRIAQLKPGWKTPNILTLLISALGALISLLGDYLSEAGQRRFGWDLKWKFPGYTAFSVHPNISPPLVHRKWYFGCSWQHMKMSFASAYSLHLKGSPPTFSTFLGLNSPKE